jgi:hypothetical protein
MVYIVLAGRDVPMVTHDEESSFASMMFDITNRFNSPASCSTRFQHLRLSILNCIYTAVHSLHFDFSPSSLSTPSLPIYHSHPIVFTHINPKPDPAPSSGIGLGFGQMLLLSNVGPHLRPFEFNLGPRHSGTDGGIRSYVGLKIADL